MPAQKQKTKNVASRKTRTDRKSHIQRRVRDIIQKIRQVPGTLLKMVQGIPAWIVGIPAALQQWRVSTRKKKQYRSFRLQKKIKPEPRPIPSIVELLKSTLQFIWQHKKILGTMVLVHAFLYIALLRAPLVTDMSEVIEAVNAGFENDNAQKTIEGTVATLGTVLSVSGESQANPAVVTLVTIGMSLIYIWAIRELHTQKKIKARDAYYQGLAPLLSTALLLLVASIQLIPFVVTAFVYATARTSGLFASGFEDLAVFLVTAGMGLLSLYWVTATVIGLYVVTLPGMYPRQALRSAKKLVQFQRLTVFKKILALPFVIGIFYFTVLLFVVRLIPAQSFVAVEVLQLIILPFAHIYLYKLYRALI